MLSKSKVIFNQENHTYTLDGKVLSGITSVLSKMLFKDKYSGVPESVLHKAAQRGSYIHECCELVDDLGVETECVEANNYLKLCKDNDLRFCASEYLVSDNKDFASSIDKVFEKDGIYDLADIKTTAKLDLEYVRWQLSIYAYFFELNNKKLQVGKLYAIYLRGDEYKLVEVERIDKKIVKKLLKCAMEGTEFENPFASKVNLPEVYSEDTITEICEQRKYWEEKYKDVTKRILTDMTDKQEYSWTGNKVLITRRKDSVTKRFDVDRFKEEHPDLYEDYLKEATITGSITIKLQ